MIKKKRSRYAQLTDVQRKVLHDETQIVIIAEQLDSYTGPAANLPFFQAAMASFRTTVAHWNSGPQFVHAFLLHSNELSKRGSKRGFETYHSQFKNGFAKFVALERLENAPLAMFDYAMINRFVFWLKKAAVNQGSNKALSANTQRKYYSLLKAFLEILRKSKHTKMLISNSLAFPDNPFPDADKSTKKTETLDDYNWKRLIIACRDDIAEVVESVLSGWRLLEGDEIHPDDAACGRGRRYASRGAALWRVKELFPILIPNLTEMRKIDCDLSAAVEDIHRQQSITRPFYPLVKDILPFILLHAIYTVANPSGLRALKWAHMKEVDVMGIRRILYTFEKGRASSYQRSFAVHPENMFSPMWLHDFIEKWTSSIRRLAGPFENNVYIFVTQSRIVRSFDSATDTGRDSDSSWNFAMKQFLRKHALPHLTLKVIRNTGLDVIRVLTDDDMRAIQAAGGQASAATVELHYNGAAAKRRREESLGAVSSTQERMIRSAGRIDPRHSPRSEDILAATPGWGCNDPYSSPIPGQTHGTLCAAFGSCPACPLTYLNNSSSYVLVRVLQLTEEVRKAQTYLDAQRWTSAYTPVLKALLSKWIPSFVDSNVRDGAAKLVLGPIGRLE